MSTGDVDDLQAVLRAWGDAMTRAADAVRPVLIEFGRAIERVGEALREALLSLTSKPVLVVDDPAERWAATPREFAAQLRDIVLHEYWCAAGQPERSPGARWERRRGESG